jgi:hypothetical protein
MAEPTPETLWNQWRTHAAECFIREAVEFEAGGGTNLYSPGQKDAAAQTWRNAARKIRNMPMPPLPR